MNTRSEGANSVLQLSEIHVRSETCVILKLAFVMAFLGVVSWSLAVDTLRLFSICAFLVCSLSFTWYSFISLIAVLGEPLQLKPIIMVFQLYTHKTGSLVHRLLSVKLYIYNTYIQLHRYMYIRVCVGTAYILLIYKIHPSFCSITLRS